MKKLVRITTVPLSLEKLLEGQLRFMSEYYHVTAVSSGAEVLERVGKREGVDTACVELTRRITPFKDLAAIAKLWRLMRRQRPHIVHTHTPKAGLAGMAAAWLAGVPNRLHTVAGLPLMETSGLKRQVLMLVERLTYAMATRVYPNSQGLREFITDNRLCPPRKLKVIANGSSNGIDTSHFSWERLPSDVREQTREALGIEPHQTVFCFVGRLVAQKGIGELIRAFEETFAEHPAVRLLLVGAEEEDLDPLDDRTRTAISSHPAISCTGFVDDVRTMLAVSEALVLPSYREGFPNVLMQAGAMGLPCIATDISGCREIVCDGVNGLIVPAKNAAALRDAMRKLAADDDLRRRLARPARQMIADRYEQRYVWEKLLEEYRALE